MKIKKNISILVVTIVLSVIFSPEILAYNTEDISQADHIASVIEKIGENINLKLKFNSNSKAEYRMRLADKRLSEVLFISENERYDKFEEVTNRYSAYIGRLTEYLKSNNVSKKEDLSKMINLHKAKLSKEQSKYEYNSAWWLLLQHNINVLDELNSLHVEKE